MRLLLMKTYSCACPLCEEVMNGLRKGYWDGDGGDDDMINVLPAIGDEAISIGGSLFDQYDCHLLRRRD